MPHISDKDLSKRYEAILAGHQNLVVWGAATRNAVIHEWQRQIPARLFVDTQWGWWDNQQATNIAIASPDQIKNFDPSQTTVINNFYFSPVTKKIENYLGRIGGYQLLKPAPLHELVRRVATNNDKPLYDGRKTNLFETVNTELKKILIKPSELYKAKKRPDIKTYDFFRSYTASNYFEQALPHLREESARTFKPRSGHVCLLIGALHPGGAERQLCNLAVGLVQHGWKVTVLVYEQGTKETIHYRQFLDDHGVGYHLMRLPDSEYYYKETLDILKRVPEDILLALWHLRAEILLQTVLTYNALRDLRPELLISYLDWQNTYASLGGLLAGVPKILMSGRNAAPTHFPHFYSAFTDFFRDNYRLVLRQRGVVLSNNSNWGGMSYSKWLNLPNDTVQTVLNCITEEFKQPIKKEFIKIKKMQMELPDNQPIILGVFRLSPEKKPLDFIRVVAALHKKYPKLRAIICGQGPMKDEVMALIKKNRLENTISLEGIASDIPLIMSSSTLLLHTAEAEGSPNVVLEAQAMGLPVVCTNSGGIVPCLSKDLLSYMRKIGDIRGLAAACDTLLKNSTLRKKIARQSRHEILKRFSLKELTHNTLAAAGIHKSEYKKSLKRGR